MRAISDKLTQTTLYHFTKSAAAFTASSPFFQDYPAILLLQSGFSQCAFTCRIFAYCLRFYTELITVQ